MTERHKGNPIIGQFFFSFYNFAQNMNERSKYMGYCFKFKHDYIMLHDVELTDNIAREDKPVM